MKKCIGEKLSKVYYYNGLSAHWILFQIRHDFLNFEVYVKLNMIC